MSRPLSASLFDITFNYIFHLLSPTIFKLAEINLIFPATHRLTDLRKKSDHAI